MCLDQVRAADFVIARVVKCVPRVLGKRRLLRGAAGKVGCQLREEALRRARPEESLHARLGGAVEWLEFGRFHILTRHSQSKEAGSRLSARKTFIVNEERRSHFARDDSHWMSRHPQGDALSMLHGIVRQGNPLHSNPQPGADMVARRMPWVAAPPFRHTLGATSNFANFGYLHPKGGCHQRPLVSAT